MYMYVWHLEKKTFSRVIIIIMSLSQWLSSTICWYNFFADDYYDTEDPSVNLHEFIVNSMQVGVCVCSLYNVRI